MKYLTLKKFLIILKGIIDGGIDADVFMTVIREGENPEVIIEELLRVLNK